MDLNPLPFGNYYLLERLAVGGMAEVYLSKCFGAGGFEQLVALKRILPNIAEDDEFIAMFIDEAKIAGQLHHDNIASIFDLGKINESYFIAMEYISGHDIRTIWDRANERGMRLPIAMACHVTRRICEALDYAHKRRDPRGRPLGIIHRDVSPQNILVAYDGPLKVIDFGIAKATNRMVKTQTGILKGKFAYMAPEQARGEPTDHRADIFAIGVILYELLTGERAFRADSDFALLEKVRKVDIVPPRKYNPEVPKVLTNIVYKAMAQKPAERYGWASEFAAELEAFQHQAALQYSDRELGQFVSKLFKNELHEEKRRLDEYRSYTPSMKKAPKTRSADFRSDINTQVRAPDRNSPEATQFVSRDDFVSAEVHDEETSAGELPLVDETSQRQRPSRTAEAIYERVSDSDLSQLSGTHTPVERVPGTRVDPRRASSMADSELEEAPTTIGTSPFSNEAPSQAKAAQRKRPPPTPTATRTPTATEPKVRKRAKSQSHVYTHQGPQKSGLSAALVWTGILAFFLGALLTALVFSSFFQKGSNVVLMSDPSGASVSSQGKKICKATPCLYSLEKGKHELLFETPLSKAKVEVDLKNANIHIAKAVLRETRDVPITTTPEGATVKVNGKTLKRATPLVLKSLATDEEITLSFTKEGFSELVEVKKVPKSGPLDFTLLASSTTHVIKVVPDDARLISGEGSRTKELKVVVKKDEPQALVARRPGCKDKAISLLATGNPNEKRTIALSCEKLTAKLDVTSSARALVTIDGVFLGMRTPLRQYSITPGTHTVTLSRGKRSASFLINTIKDERVRLETKFR